MSTAIERTIQLKNQLTDKKKSKMSNNADLTLDEVFNVKGKVALVTGGGSGIGLMVQNLTSHGCYGCHIKADVCLSQITQALAVNGAKVYIVGRTQEKLDTVVKAHGQNIAGEIIPIVGDVSKKEGVE